MNIWSCLLSCAAVLLSFAGSLSVRAANVNDFLDFSTAGVPGRLYVPPEASTSSEPRPLILFLHGAGEVGTNNVTQVNGNIDNLLDEAKARGAFLYAPQANGTWADTTRTSTVMSMIDQTLVDFNVNPNRLYVTGLSMGGGGVWNMLNRFDDRFAAGVPIAAVSPSFDFDPLNLVGKPTWAFHARNDNVVPSTTSRNVVNRILEASGTADITYPPTTDQLQTFLYQHDEVDLSFTEFPLGGHGIWGSVYDTPEMHDWLFAQTLQPATPITPSDSMQLVINTTSPFYPIGTPDGIAIPAGGGFAAVGSFTLSDEVISHANAGTLANLAADFLQFGMELPIGVRSVEGLLNVNTGAALSPAGNLLGKNIYLVVGDGEDIMNSSALMIYKSPAIFQTGVPPLNLVSGSEPFLGGLLLGTPGSVFVNRGGGIRDGVLAADMTVPEPSTSFLLVLGFCLPALRHLSASSCHCAA